MLVERAGAGNPSPPPPPPPAAPPWHAPARPGPPNAPPPLHNARTRSIKAWAAHGDPADMAGEAGDADVDVEAIANERAAPAKAWQSDEALEARKGVYCCGACCGFVGLLLFVILLPISFKGVEYYEYGFLVRQSTGKVSLDEVYTPGNHFVGPDFTFKKFQSDAHIVRYDALSVFSAGNEDSVGLEFKLDITFAYRLRKDKLVELHNELERQYAGVVDSRARDGIKNEAVNIAFASFFEERLAVERTLREALKKRLSSLNVEVVAFHLGRVEIPTEVREKQLETRVQNERNDRETYTQQAEVERALTEYEVNKVLLQKDQVLRTAKAQANLITLTAEADAERIEKSAQSKGLQQLYAATGLVSDKHKASFDYARTILRHANATLDVGYVSEPSLVASADGAGQE